MALNEVDLDYLLIRNFNGWKRYLINQHYRVELNINDTNKYPLPLLNQVKIIKEDAKNITQEVDGDIREKIIPKNDEEKRSLVRARE